MPKSSTKKNSKPITHINSKKIPCRSNVQEIFFCAQRVRPFVHLCINVVIPSVNHTLGLAYAGKGNYLLLTTAISLLEEPVILRHIPLTIVPSAGTKTAHKREFTKISPQL